MAIQNFFTSRDNNLDGNTYVGQLGRLWYNPDTNSLYASDGSTVGGIPVELAANANALINNLTVTSVTSPSSTVNVVGDLAVSGNIPAATETKIGGVRAGPGANIGNTGLLTIDTTGLPLSFGNFTANNNILTIVNTDENMVLATQGSAEIQLVGNIGFYATNGLPPANPGFFSATDDGQIVIRVPAEDPLLGAVQIIGSNTGNIIPPAVAGVMLHVTGNQDSFASIYVDGIGGQGAFVGRRYNGDTTSPMPVQNGDSITRLVASGYSTTGFPSAGPGGIHIDAIEDFVGNSQGTQIKFLTAALGTDNRVVVATVDNQNGVSATEFNTTGNVTANLFVGNLTGSADTANTATDLAAATNILAGTITVDPAIVNRSTASVQTFTLTGLTTNHKIVITSGTALNYGMVITAAWASAANTLSVEFQNFTSNQDINLPAKTLQYFAWV